jgi:hypothetical protein
VQLRYRVTPIEAVPETTAVVTVGNSDVPAPLGSVRVEIGSASIAAHAADGSAWDTVGGEPDPYVVVSARGRELDRSAPVSDTREVRLNRVLPAVRLTDFPIRFVVYDEDVTTDDVIGVADVQASSLSPSAVDLLLDLRSEGQSPVQTGTLRVRMTPVQ